MLHALALDLSLALALLENLGLLVNLPSEFRLSGAAGPPKGPAGSLSPSLSFLTLVVAKPPPHVWDLGSAWQQSHNHSCNKGS
jgi:hypothetical protein